MVKRKKKKSTGSTTPVKKPFENAEAGQPEDPKTSPGDERADYGGIPFRDLKKNLGCG